jgi:hypothetical protein
MITNCLTFEQLDAYSTKKIDNVERAQLYQHISTCDLCACAVNGFAAIPFTSDDLVAIHREIDVRSGTPSVNPLIFARVGIVVASVLSVIGINLLCITHPEHKPTVSKIVPKNLTLNITHHEAQKASAEEISSAAETFKKIVNAAKYKTFERNITPIERLDLIKPAGISESALGLSEVELITYPDKNVIYIYDLRISNYNGLYFSPAVLETNLFKTHTPVYKENKKSLDEESSFEKRVIPPDRVLKHGLESFNKHNFAAALESFHSLLENNENDVNAQFYSALSFYNINKADKALEYLAKVMKNPDTTFYAEAQWFRALVYLKSGNRETARAILSAIVSEKGFYSKRAAEKLKKA